MRPFASDDEIEIGIQVKWQATRHNQITTRLRDCHGKQGRWSHQCSSVILTEKAPKKVIVVKNRIVNVVV